MRALTLRPARIDVSVMDLLLAVIGANDSAFSAFLSAEADGLDTPSARDAGAEAMADRFFRYIRSTGAVDAARARANGAGAN